MAFDSIKDVVPYLGAYFAAAVILCALFIAVDILSGCSRRKFLIPGKFFNGNPTSISLMSTGLSILLDLSSNVENDSINKSTSTGLLFMAVMMSFLHFSLATHSQKKLWTKTFSLFIPAILLMLNKCVILFVQGYAPFTPSLVLIAMVFVSPITISLIVPSLVTRANFKYNQLAIIRNPYSQHETHQFSPRVQELTFEIKKNWVMAQTADPKFLLACCPISHFVSLCSILFCYLQRFYRESPRTPLSPPQLALAFASLARSIALFLRYLVLTYNSTLAENFIIPFRVQNHWFEQLEERREDYSLVAHIPGKNTKIVFQFLLRCFLYILEAFHMFFMSFYEINFAFDALVFGPLIRIAHKIVTVRRHDDNPNNTANDEDYFRFAVHLDEATRVSNRYVQRCINRIHKVIQGSQNPRQAELLLFLRDFSSSSVDFDGVYEYADIDSGTHETCWSLVVATLTGVAIANPAIPQPAKDLLTASVREGLILVAPIERELCTDPVSVLDQSASKQIWSQVVLFQKWYQVDLQTNEQESYIDFLNRLKTKSENIERSIDSQHMGMIQDEVTICKYIMARCMNQVVNTMLRRLGDTENQIILEGLFLDTRRHIDVLLCACFTNIPTLVVLKCHEVAMDKREKSILMAARLLARSKDILPCFENQRLPLNLNSMAYLNEWRADPSPNSDF